VKVLNFSSVSDHRFSNTDEKTLLSENFCQRSFRQMRECLYFSECIAGAPVPLSIFGLVCLKCLLDGKVKQLSRVDYLHNHLHTDHALTETQYADIVLQFQTVQWKDAFSFKLLRNDRGIVHGSARKAVKKLKLTWGAEFERCVQNIIL